MVFIKPPKCGLFIHYQIKQADFLIFKAGCQPQGYIGLNWFAFQNHGPQSISGNCICYRHFQYIESMQSMKNHIPQDFLKLLK